MKPRHHLYLDDELTNELEHLAAKPGASKSAIVTAALRQYLKHKGGDERDEALRRRLDRLSGEHRKMQGDLDVLIETVTRLSWVYFLTTSHMPVPQQAGRAVANDRFNRFMDDVSRALVKRGKQLAEEAGDNAPQQLARQRIAAE